MTSTSWKSWVAAGALAVTTAPLAVRAGEGESRDRGATTEATEVPGRPVCDCQPAAGEGGAREGARARAAADRSTAPVQGRRPAARLRRTPLLAPVERDPGDAAAELAAGNTQGRG